MVKLRIGAAIGVAALLATSLTPAHAAAPGKGRAFEPRPVSKSLYAIQPPEVDPQRQTHFVEGAGGTDIYVETWLPAELKGRRPPAKIPTVLVITPYQTSGTVAEPRTLEAVVPRGYAYSQMHVRGTGASGGCMEQFSSNEVEDAANVIEYLGKEAPWSNGRIGGSGLSYPGISLVAVAGRGDPQKTKYLKAIIAGGVASSQYEYNFFDGVPFTTAGAAHSFFYNGVNSPWPDPQFDPVRYAEKQACTPEIMVGSVESDGDVTDFWADRDHRAGVKNIRAATFLYHGHYDMVDSSIAMAGLFDELPDSTPKHALVGAFAHAYPYNTGTTAWDRADFVDMQVAWFDRYVKGLDSGVDTWPTAQIQGMDGQWRAESEWPTTGGPVGQLALSGDGALGASGPRGSTTYRELGPNEAPTDGTYARFTTEPVKDELHITGIPILDLWATLSEPDAHIAATIEVLDDNGRVQPEGTTYGFRSARHLEPIRDHRFVQAEGKPAPVGEPVRIQVRFNPSDIIVPEGGRLRLTISGSSMGTSWYTSDPSGAFTDVTILHDCKHPSALRFLMPKERPRLLNVREIGETKLKSSPSGKISVTGGGIATKSVCGAPPQRIALLAS